MDNKKMKENKDDSKKNYARRTTENIESNVNIYKRNLMQSGMPHVSETYRKTEQKSKKFYDKFVNGFKKTNDFMKSIDENEEDKEGNKYMNIEKMMMDQIIIKEDNNYHTIKTPLKNELDEELPRVSNFSDNDYCFLST